MSLLITFSILERLWPGTLQLAAVRQERRGERRSGRSLFLAILVGGGRRGGGDDHRRPADSHPDPAQGHGPGADPRRAEDLHPDPADHRRRDADHLCPDDHHRAGHPRELHQESGAAPRSPSFFSPGDLPYDLTFAILILLFSYFYTSIIFNSVDLAENLKKQGGFIPGVKPGASTADYIDARAGADHAAGRPLPRGRRAAADPGLQVRSASRPRVRRHLRAHRRRACCSTPSPRWNSTGRCGSTTAS